MKNKLIIPLSITIIIILSILIYFLNYFNIIPKKSYTNQDFNISNYKSNIDKDNDYIDDQTDILLSARDYVKTKPKYKSKYYATGYSNDKYGVCTDVVAVALLNSGYDLMKLVNDDIINNRSKYNIEKIDKNIDFRRVVNLEVYFENNYQVLTTDINKIEEWQGGDIVIFPKHIAIVSDKRNKQGIPYIIHNGGQIVYEEDTMNNFNIIGHYRLK